ncbi:unnamed protein product, partial [Mesorhabditis belari]|uniref:RNA helicase n=1 Tax=Mesorhabditis belari TaxID=2138241 RepID=A0AAF3EYI9_9BILA
MSTQSFFNNGPIGEWNGPPAGNAPPPQMHNGFSIGAPPGVMDGQIGMFQIPQANQFGAAGAQAAPRGPPGIPTQDFPVSHYGTPAPAFHKANQFRGQISGSASDAQLMNLIHQNPQQPARTFIGGSVNGFEMANGFQQPMNNYGAMNGGMNGFIPNGHSNDRGLMQPFEAPKPLLVGPPPFDINMPHTLPPSRSDPALYQQVQQPQQTINFENYENIPVNIRGDNVPTPVNEFHDANLDDVIKMNVDKSGYIKPTPVQKHGIPSLLSGRDLMACAQTGSGKTAAFLLPIIQHIVTSGLRPYEEMNQQARRMKQFPFALILSPTRELAIQIHKEATKFSYCTNVMTAIFYGGKENYRDQLNKSRYGCHIVIATPGRLIDVVNQGYVSLEQCKFLVLDEADRMLDMGFEPQIRKIVSLGLPDKMARQTAMFSATFPNEIKKLAEDFLKPNFVHLAVGRIGSTSQNIDQNVIWVEEYEKRGQLQHLLDNEERNALILVFVETRRAANDLAFQLQRAGHRAVAIHGDLKQLDRERNLEMFKNGSNPILVATAVAARGLDIPNVKHVINYDMPNDVDEYVHRIGRTGRCGNQGQASSFFAEKNKGLARDLLAVLNESNQNVPDWLPPLATQSFNQRNNKFARGRGRGTNGFQNGQMRNNFVMNNNQGMPRGGGNFGGVQRGGFQGGMMHPMGMVPFPAGPPPPIHFGGAPPFNPQFNPVQPQFGGPGGFGTIARGGFNRGGGGGYRGNRGGPSGGGNRGGINGTPAPMRNMMGPGGLVNGMNQLSIGGEWQPRTATVPN